MIEHDIAIRAKKERDLARQKRQEARIASSRIRQLQKQLGSHHFRELRGLIKGDLGPVGLLGKQHQAHRLHKEIDTLKKTEKDRMREAQYREHEARTLERLASKVRYGDSLASSEATRLAASLDRKQAF